MNYREGRWLENVRRDINAPGFAAECTRRVRLVRKRETEQDWADGESWWSLSDTTGWTA
jgi:hypothetical protein